MSRRIVNGYFGGALVAGCAATPDAATPNALAEGRSGERLATDQWMQAWMTEEKRRFRRDNPGASDKAAAGSLFLGRFADRIYFTTSVIGWTPTTPTEKERYPAVRVPTYFVTDFASVPRLFWSALPPDGQYAYAAVVHDYLYWEQDLPRDISDDILKMLMSDFRVPSVEAFAIYNGVRIGGQAAWDENAKLKALGEKRVLRTIPDDPTILWEEWKRRPDAF